MKFKKKNRIKSVFIHRCLLILLGFKHVGKVNQMMKKFQAAISTLVEERVDPRLMSWALMELQFWLVKKEEYSE